MVPILKFVVSYNIDTLEKLGPTRDIIKDLKWSLSDRAASGNGTNYLKFYKSFQIPSCLKNTM